MLDAGLLADSRHLIDQARVIAEASAAPGGQTGRSHPTSRVPPGTWAHERSTLDQLGAQINVAIASGSDSVLAAANALARSELHLLTHGPDRSAETPAQFHWRVCSEGEGQTASVVARRELTSITTVRKIRVADGRDAARGRKLPLSPAA